MKSPYCFSAGGWMENSCFLQFSRDGSIYEYWPCRAEYWNAVILPAVRQGTWFNATWRHHIPPNYAEVSVLPPKLLYTFQHP